jgi:hypothetical protein
MGELYTMQQISNSTTVQSQFKLWNVYSTHRGTRPIPEYSILLARLDSTEHIIEYTGGEVETVFLKAFTRQILSEKTLTFSILSTIYFVASKHPGYYHILKFYPHINRFSCSCLVGKRGGHCDCQIELDAHLQQSATPVLNGACYV